jgi:hypothetical protein
LADCHVDNFEGENGAIYQDSGKEALKILGRG